MEILFATLMVLSHFDPFLPKLSDYQNGTSPELVHMYSGACRNLFAQPEFKNLGLQDILQNVLSSPQFSHSLNLDKKIDTTKVIDLYKKICREQPDETALAGLGQQIQQAETLYINLVNSVKEIKITPGIKLPESIEILDRDGKLLTESFLPQGRRKWVSMNNLPTYVPLAFVSVEDKRFFEHKGADEVGILRAIMKSIISSGRPEGASTITQQVARNLFLDSSLSLERKLKEILIAEKIESTLLKRQILEIYLNLIYFGRNSWGIAKAAESYFGKTPDKLTIPEVAYLVGIVQGPNLYQSDRARIEERVNFVLSKFHEEGIIPAPRKVDMDKDLKFVDVNTSINTNYFRDYLMSELNGGAGLPALVARKPILSTIHAKLQKVAEESLQDGLIAYEKFAGRHVWRRPVANIAKQIEGNIAKIKQARENAEMESQKSQQSLFGAVVAQGTAKAQTPTTSGANSELDDSTAWVMPLLAVRRTLPPPAQRWQVGVVLDANGKIGVIDGVMKNSEGVISPEGRQQAPGLRYGDVVYVVPAEAAKEYDVVHAPEINGAVVAMDPLNGEILAMAGGFSYQLSSWNRAVSAYRQPGSLIKPMTYMAALQAGIQPNTILEPGPFRFPPVERGGKPWQPANYDGSIQRPMPMRWALENSVNTMTAYLMSLIGFEPVRNLMKAFGLYENPGNEYPIILGSQESNLLTLVKVYSEIANEGKVVVPSAFREGTRKTTTYIPGVDTITLYQVRYMMQGVLERGTASRLRDLAPYVAGKTGTSNDAKDVWFIAFTPNLVVGAYVGYDNPRSLGPRATGGTVALAIVEKILRQSFVDYKDKEEFVGYPQGVTIQLTDRTSGQILDHVTSNSIYEAYRAD